MCGEPFCVVLADQFPSHFLGGGHGVPVERGCPFLSFVPPCGSGCFGENFQCVEFTLARVWKVLLNWFNFPS